VNSISSENQMGMPIDKSWQNSAPAKIDNLRVTGLLFDFVTRPDDIDLAIANEHSGAANHSEVGQFIADARAFRTRQRDELRRVKKSERLQVSLLCTI